MLWNGEFCIPHLHLSYTYPLTLKINVEVKGLRPNALGGDGEDFVEVSLNLEGHQLITSNIATQEFGGLFERKHQSTLVLRELSGHHNATPRAWLIHSDASTREKPVYEPFIIIYGLHSQKDAIGDALDGAELFLQDLPEQIKVAHPLPYSNPHRLYNPAFGNGVNLPPERTAGVPIEMTKQQSILCETEKQMFRGVMDSACGPQYFSASQQSPRLRTRLKQ